MRLEIDHKSKIPLHVQAEELLRELIHRKEYQEGRYLPNEVDLSEQLKISRNTLRQAINKLVFEELLVRKKGVGTRVTGKKVFSSAINWMSFSQEMKILGISIHNFELHVSWQIPSPHIASFFNSSPSDRVLNLERLRGKENFPFVYFVSQFNPKIGLNGSENFNRPLYEILEQDYGIIVKTSKEEVNAAPANNFIASKLGLEEGDPILIRKRYVYDINNVEVEYNIGYYRADSFTYTIECSRNT
ncbi:GntR family transcriptional regulator [Dysgonomonas reticulitermitis]